ITKLQLAAMSRVDIPESERKDFYLYVDEFQNFATESFASILSEARKYRLNLTLGHQYITQMDETVRDAVFGNVGTLVLFRIGAEDADFLEREFTPEFMAQDLVGLGKYNVYLKLMIDGVAGRPFSAETLPPMKVTEVSSVDKIIKASRERYGVSKVSVEDKIKRWTGIDQMVQAKPAASSAPLYDAVCSSCNKPTKVVFHPEHGRPVYCKNCLNKIKKPAEPTPQASVSLKKAVEVPLKPKRKEVDLPELRKALEQSREDGKTVINPGETVKFK
ncbi:TraM recognition domain-containing protein, partial [Patescibacteria group bacterium]|nr:TraM recognition domain-containing protein [Patescibacteria group bacterium]